MTCPCTDREDYEHYEKSIQLKSGIFQVTRIRRTRCTVCGKLWLDGIDLDACRSNRNSGYYGITYEGGS